MKSKLAEYIVATVVVVFMVVLIAILGRYVIRPVYYGWPLTVEQAANTVLSDLNPSDIEKFKNMKKEELIRLHMGFGQGIRNDFGLWRGNAFLQRSSGTHHPDDASMVIIEAAWEKLHE